MYHPALGGHRFPKTSCLGDELLHVFVHHPHFVFPGDTPHVRAVLECSAPRTNDITSRGKLGSHIEGEVQVVQFDCFNHCDIPSREPPERITEMSVYRRSEFLKLRLKAYRTLKEGRAHERVFRDVLRSRPTFDGGNPFSGCRDAFRHVRNCQIFYLG